MKYFIVHRQKLPNEKGWTHLEAYTDRRDADTRVRFHMGMGIDARVIEAMSDESQ